MSEKRRQELAAKVVELRQTLPTFGARRLIREFDPPLSQLWNGWTPLLRVQPTPLPTPEL